MSYHFNTCGVGYIEIAMSKIDLLTKLLLIIMRVFVFFNYAASG